jgi:hypothetical protein
MSRFVLNKEGVRELLQSAEMVQIITDASNDVASRARDGFEADVIVGKNRIVGHIKVMTKEAKLDNEENNTLLRAIGG